MTVTSTPVAPPFSTDLEAVRLSDVHAVGREVLAAPVAVATVKPRGER